jgi:hypothetical protein
MPRKHKRRADGWSYGYSKEALEKASVEERATKWALRRVIFLTILIAHVIKNYHAGRKVRSTVSTPAEESTIVHAFKH